ncbi:PilN domain-containing protein [Methylotenera versatilis]|uniref:Fimbrial assembly family protein n=1 Tax=Methylotenera versatilis (strain 301) TaxID=666681 RepID=D7DNC3_METV0|nr:PilN domain-containing protein [Methylotenera versatilis]ADI30924.1 Fimbrial assembly family protein [Methylotenera versatilis 301]
MIRVNLLPHRQIRREARQREFGLMALFSAIAAAVVIFLGYTYITAKIDAQAERNARLDAAIVKLDKEIADIKDLKDQISTMLERKQVVENLQTNRSQAVVVLDELSRQLPEGMYLKSIKQQGNIISVEGVADTNARVATLVRNLSTSNWMESPSLVEIKSVVVNTLKQNAFALNVNIKVPKVETDEKSVKGGK